MSTHSPGASVVDIWDRKKRQGLPPTKHSKRWLARAQLKPGVARYRTKAFAIEQDAWQWAEDTVAKYRLGLDNGSRLSISAILDDYIEHLKGKGASPKHVIQVRWVLTKLIEAGINNLRDERLPAKAEAHFRNLKTQLTNANGTLRRIHLRDASPRTKNCYLSALLALCAWATRMRMLPYDPIKGIITRFKEPKKTKPIFSLAELSAILSDKHRNQRFWLPFALSLYSGTRISEAVHLEWQDIKWEERRIHIRLKSQYRLKGQKERYAPLQDELIEILQPMAKPHGWIVDEKTRNHPKTWRWFFKRLLLAAGMQMDGRSPHSTRHQWAALSTASSLDPFHVMELAGHSSLNTTLRYSRCASLFREAVAGWEKGKFQLRTAPGSCAANLKISTIDEVVSKKELLIL